MHIKKTAPHAILKTFAVEHPPPRFANRVRALLNQPPLLTARERQTWQLPEPREPQPASPPARPCPDVIGPRCGTPHDFGNDLTFLPCDRPSPAPGANPQLQSIREGSARRTHLLTILSKNLSGCRAATSLLVVGVPRSVK